MAKKKPAKKAAPKKAVKAKPPASKPAKKAGKAKPRTPAKPPVPRSPLTPNPSPQGGEGNKTPRDPSAAAGQQHREAMAKRSREQFGAVADIGAIPPVVDPERRERCRLDLHDFLVTYFPGTTGLSPFSADHLRVIARLQEAAQQGGRYFNLVYRGFAKTTISVNTALWALLYGHRRLVVLIGANKAAASDMLDAIKAELETNELLAEDFPEVCVAVAALEGKVQRCGSQTCQGEQTHIEWTQDRVVLPTVRRTSCPSHRSTDKMSVVPSAEYTPSSGSTVVTRGITSSIRGIGQRRVDGTQQRPDLVICDDLQTDASALSPVQVGKRLKTLSKSILKLAGHNSTIACVVNGTIIEPDDLMDRLRDPVQYPGWQGETFKMVSRWSDAHETLWLTDYARIRKGFDPTQPGDQDRAHAEANDFYREHRAEMDAGCVVGWEHCYDHELEQSAIQHAYNFLIDDGEDVFAAECQSDPVKRDTTSEQLTLTDITSKLSGLKRGQPPANTAKLVCYIDTQDQSFWWVAIAWTADYTGYVIDYGVWPEQGRSDISKGKLKVSLEKKYPHFRNPEARHRAGLADLCDAVLGRDWIDPDGGTHRISAALVDVKDGAVRKSIPSWIAGQKRWKTILRPAMGVGLKAGDLPFGERKKDAKKEKRRGLYWHEDKDPQTPGGSIVFIDANSAKSFLANRWRVASPRPKDDPSYRPCESGALYLWGTDPREHATFGAHHLAETVTRVTHEKSGRLIDFWQQKPNHPDNEWFDCAVGCCVLADFAGGISLKDAGLATAPRTKKRLSAADIRARREASRRAA